MMMMMRTTTTPTTPTTTRRATMRRSVTTRRFTSETTARRCGRPLVARVRASAGASDPEGGRESPFAFEQELDGVETRLAALSTPARLGAYGAVVAAGAAIGNAVGGVMPVGVRNGAKVVLTAAAGNAVGGVMPVGVRNGAKVV